MSNETVAKRQISVPEWAQELKRKYQSKNVSQFIVHGNINDYVRVVDDGKNNYLKVRDFVNQELFRYRDMVIHYDRSAGLRFKDDIRFGGDSNMRKDFENTLKFLARAAGMQERELKVDPQMAFFDLDRYLNHTLNQNLIRYIIRFLEKKAGIKSKSGKSAGQSLSEGNYTDVFSRMPTETKLMDDIEALFDFDSDSKTKSKDKSYYKDQLANFQNLLDKPRSIGLIIDYAETLIPMGEGSRMREKDQMVLVFLQKWAREEVFLSSDFTTIVLTENIADINQQYIRNPYTHEIFVPYPDATERLHFITDYFENNKDGAKYFEMSHEVLAKNTAGLNLVNLETILSEAIKNEIPFTNDELTQKKKEMIEAEAGGLLEFIETKYNLKDVAGHAHAKKHLMDASRALANGRQDVLPMGYLVSGPVGTGKTFMIKTFASDIGVPMVMLKNFRSQWQGVTEGNLQKVLKILKAMSPVAVMIDEADAYLGNRSASGDSGVSSRVFSMIATFMSDTDNRGKIIWFLVTARPDLMPVDFKRQGRAEEHIGLFYPESLAEKKELLQVMLRKTGLKYLKIDEFDEEFLEDMTVKSGADMEAALTRAKFKAASLGLEKVNFDIIAQVFNDFLPPTYPEEIELMTYSAVLESTSKELLPKRFRDMSRQEVMERVESLKTHIR